MKKTVNLQFLQEREAELKKRIEAEKARDAQQTVGSLETELEVTQLAIIGYKDVGPMT